MFFISVSLFLFVFMFLPICSYVSMCCCSILLSFFSFIHYLSIFRVFQLLFVFLSYFLIFFFAGKMRESEIAHKRCGKFLALLALKTHKIACSQMFIHIETYVCCVDQL